MQQASTDEPEFRDRLEVVTLQRLRKVYGRRAVLSEVSGQLRAGETTVLAGPNGAGKSTLLGILSTLARPTSGEVRYGTCSHDDARALLRQRIGLLTHAPLVYPELTVRENLLFFAGLYELPDPGASVSEQLRRFALEEHADRPARELSRGTLQRASLARALLHDPELLLLDEPFSGLDQRAIEKLRAAISAARAARKIVVVVTHELDAIDGICDQLLLLVGGRLAHAVTRPEMSAAAVRELYQEHVR